MGEQDKENLEKLVSYDEKASTGQCIITDCEEEQKKLVTKRRYEIDEEPESCSNDMRNNDSENKSNLYNIAQNCSGEKGSRGCLLDYYVTYCKVKNISKCLIKNCERAMSGRRTHNVKRHYHKVHNFIIVHDYEETIQIMNKELNLYFTNDAFGNNLFDYDIVPSGTKSAYISNLIKIRNGSPQNTSFISIKDLVIRDKQSLTYQCLFINCNDILKKHLPTIKRHYYETHKIIIAKLDILPRLFKKNNVNNRDTTQNESEFSIDGEEEDVDESVPICFVKNELLSDDEFPHSSKKFCPSAIKDDTNTSNDIFPKSSTVEITITKSNFLKLCFDLIIERGLKVNLFDDEILFKKLLAPFEEALHCNVNSTMMKSLITSTDGIVVSSLAKMYCNKVVSLELNVLSSNKKYYLIFSVRFLTDQYVICNRVIGLLPITDMGSAMPPIFEYLGKFGIDKEQVYMTTILGLLDDEEINKICDNICKHNPEIRMHPISYVQKIFSIFVQNYSENIKSWQKLVNYESNLNTNMLSNLKNFATYMKSLPDAKAGADTQPEYKIKQIILFLKSVEILISFIENLSEEQYVAGDLYRDWLCCELELKGEATKNHNEYAGKLYEVLTKCKNTLLKNREFIAALYLDPRFNFSGSCLLNNTLKTEAKTFLCSIWEKFANYVQTEDCSSDSVPLNADSSDDKYALLTQHVNDIMPGNVNVCIEDIISSCILSKREPFSLDILKYWHCRGKNTKDNKYGLIKIAFTCSSSQYISLYLQKKFHVSCEDTDEAEKFLIKHNRDIVEQNICIIFDDLS